MSRLNGLLEFAEGVAVENISLGGVDGGALRLNGSDLAGSGWVWLEGLLLIGEEWKGILLAALSSSSPFSNIPKNSKSSPVLVEGLFVCPSSVMPSYRNKASGLSPSLLWLPVPIPSRLSISSRSFSLWVSIYSSNVRMVPTNYLNWGLDRLALINIGIRPGRILFPMSSGVKLEASLS